KLGSRERSGFYMRARLVRTPFPLPSDLPPLDKLVAERLAEGASPIELVSEVDASPEEFLKSIRSLCERGLFVPGSDPSPPVHAFSSTLPSSQAVLSPQATPMVGQKVAATLFGGSPALPNITERAQP